MVIAFHLRTSQRDSSSASNASSRSALAMSNSTFRNMFLLWRTKASLTGSKKKMIEQVGKAIEKACRV